ncbi:MAG TPA: hypothetical protein VFV67_31625 [Actinophytocola sp.]|uniref:hypothetical protein n=1 Tax=Actinophytocola sp. TaxID=1872138 RepID=UPI002DB9C8BE|nr:hypothetical protein [Actinophytocola sp.]HEU5475217.1 hypothetical protein [Actinophytocola sp.]
MLIEKRLQAGIRDGSITVMFRRWRARQATAGKTYRTAAGLVAVDEVRVLAPSKITRRDALAAGYGSADEARADLRGDPADPVYLLRVRPVFTPDPRSVLADDDDLGPADVAEITRRLDRLDRAGPTGPWTAATLAIIAERPEVRAPDLAASLGRETAPFKLDVRKLKNLGLTISLRVGYRLSPRGAAYLRARSSQERTVPR